MTLRRKNGAMCPRVQPYRAEPGVMSGAITGGVA